MAIDHTLGFTIEWPKREEIDIENVRFNYDPVSDTLMVHLFGEPLPAFSLDVTEYESARVHLETHRIVGIQVDAFLTAAIHEDPRYVLWAMQAGVSPDDLAAALRRMTPEQTQQLAARAAIDNVERLAVAS